MRGCILELKIGTGGLIGPGVEWFNQVVKLDVSVDPVPLWWHIFLDSKLLRKT